MLTQNIKYYDEVYNYITSFYPVSQTSFNTLVEVAELKVYKAGTIIEDFGEVPTNLYVLNKGIVRSYVELKNGKEITKAIYMPTIIFGSFFSLLEKSASEYVFEAMMDTEIYCIDYSKYKAIYQENIDVFYFHAKFLEFLLCENDKMHTELLSMDAKERYLKFREVIPNVDDLLPQYQIANYLNITAVQLSRIRSKL